MTVFELLCRTLLRLYPLAFRELHGSEVVDTILDRTEELSRELGFAGTFLHMAKELAALTVGASRARWDPRYRSPRRGLAGGREGWTRSVVTDVAYSLKGFKKSPGVATVIVLTLGLGIGANTAIFSVVNGVLLRPLPYDDPDELVYIWGQRDWLGESQTLLADVQLELIREKATLFEETAGLVMVSGRIQGGERPVHTDVARTSWNFFDMLGVRPILGRVFEEGEDQPDASWVAILDYDYWMRAFGGDPDVIGKKLVVGFPEMEVIGVLPKDFSYGIPTALGPYGKPDVWIPQWHTYGPDGRARGGNETVLARLRDGVTLEQVEAELSALGAAEDSEFYGGRGFTFRAEPVRHDLTEGVRPALLVLIGAVGLVLLIAAANIATLVLVRTQARRGELALRHSLGASRLRIARQLLTENVVLAMIGGALGLVLSLWGTDALLAIAPLELPRADEVGLDWRVLGFTAAVSLLAGLLAGVTPVIQSRRTDPADALRTQARTDTEHGGNHRLRNGLVVVQIALSIVLLSGAGLLVRTFLRVQSEDPGFQAEGTLTFSVYLMQEYNSLDLQIPFYNTLRAELSAIPGVAHVSGTSALPLSAGAAQVPASLFARPNGATPDGFFLVDGVTLMADDLEGTEGETWGMVDLNTAHPGYFETVGIDLLAGRGFTENDDYRESFRTVVDEKLAERFWGVQDAIGQRLWIVGAWREVVGVVRHARMYEYHTDNRPQAYLPYGQVRSGRVSMVVRTTGEPLSLVPAIRAVIERQDANVPIADIRTMETIVRDSTAQQRFSMTLMTLFAVAAILLAALGVYGVLSFAVGRRRKEIAVRMALGSSHQEVAGLVVGEGMRLATLGGSLGILGGLAFGRIVKSLLFGVTPNDPLSFVLAGLTAGLVAFFAAWIPARRATSVDPASALRAE